MKINDVRKAEVRVELDAAEGNVVVILSSLKADAVADEYLRRQCGTGSGVCELFLHHGSYRQWNGKYYAERSFEEIEDALRNFLSVAGVWEESNDGKVWKSHPLASGKIADVARMVRARLRNKGADLKTPCWHPDSVPGLIGDILGDSDRYPAPSDLLTLRNGVLNMRTRKLMPHTPELITFNALPYDYEPAEEPVEWLKFLGSIWGDDRESILCLQEIFGYLISGRLDLEKIFALVGKTGGGKTTILHTLSLLLGEDNVANFSPVGLSSRFGLGQFVGKSAMILDDARFNWRDVKPELTERLLSISGRGKLPVEKKYQDEKTAAISARILIA